MNIIRNRLKSAFSQIPNSLLLDTRLSDKSVRVMCYLLSLPDNWEINNADIMKKLNIKRRETIAGYWKELIKFGWVSRQQLKRVNGHFSSFEYTLNYNSEIIIAEEDNKEALSPCAVEPCTVSDGVLLNSTLNNTHIHNNTIINNKNKQKEMIEEVYLYWNDKSGQKLKGDETIISNFNKILITYTLDDIKAVIDNIINSDWHKEKGQVLLSVVSKPTKFAEKLDKALYSKPTGNTKKSIKEDIHNCNSGDWSGKW